MEILIPLGFFAMIAAIVVVPRYFKSMERQKMAETIRAAIENGQSLPTEVVDAMTSDIRPKGMSPSPQRDLRTGIVWLFVAGGLAAFGLLIGMEEPDATYPLLAFAAFPGFIGAAFIVLGLLNKPKV
ncbi:DUF6249 domain-containing protein [Phenylobacterium sp. J367]|uniref:DUF6249 domain-containing protein n=1 Tax=Phenylobacterium sp. J367 TaxID=2898435 RepID=UPI002150EB81|nr:DUF6249 domain-containing protein [Phenylobacterium sp. J367]MCR5880276.1 DUF6249 domain-containing protein [Phenylobacterium sp. J367]